MKVKSLVIILSLITQVFFMLLYVIPVINTEDDNYPEAVIDNLSVINVAINKLIKM